MNPLTKKILESGIVDEHVAIMMERWGQLENGSIDLVGRKEVTKQSLTKFVEELEDLIDVDKKEYRETRLDIDIRYEVQVRFSNDGQELPAYVDGMGHLIFRIRRNLRGLKSGVELFVRRADDVGMWEGTCTVLELEPLYQDDKLVAMQVTIDRAL